MGELRTQAVVLRAKAYREADRLVTLLTRDAGKVTIVARGTKKAKSKFAALVEPLTLGHFLLHRGKSLDTLIQGEIIKAYGSLRMDLLLFAYGQYFCELCERVLPEGEEAVSVFTLLVAALELLGTEKDAARVARCFELSLLDELGFRPALEGCRNCGGTDGPFRFDPETGSLVCGDCPAGGGSFQVSGATVAVMRRFLELGFHKLSVCSVSPQVSSEIHKTAAATFHASLGLSHFKSLDFLKILENC
ncbi:MAG: DNA repair protein RecO [Bacillota bacterium]|nr:DNA repair protein RecO [Bacillota bacterium]MDW7683486.1 DNA repair protein RecO [Bacillota bacterium]